SDQPGGDALVAELWDHGRGQQYESVVADEVVGHAGDLGGSSDGLVDSRFLIVDDIELGRADRIGHVKPFIHSSPGAMSLWADADDCFALAALGGVEGGGGVVEGGDGADVGAEPSVAYALDDFPELAAE